MTMTHRGGYPGIEPTNVASTLRVMDFYRCESRKLIGNWVRLDHVDLLRQWGIDVLAKAGETGRLPALRRVPAGPDSPLPATRSP